MGPYKFQLDGIASVVFLASPELHFPLGRSDGNKTSAAKRVDCSVRVAAMDERMGHKHYTVLQTEAILGVLRIFIFPRNPDWLPGREHMLSI
jgi:hypothetical protein